MIARTPGRSGNRAASAANPSSPGRTTVALAVEPHDARRSLEGAEHEGDAAVLAEVGDGLDAAAGQVEVGDRRRPEDAERVVALGRQVDVAVGAGWGRGHEEQVLAFDPLTHGFVEAS